MKPVLHIIRHRLFPAPPPPGRSRFYIPLLIVFIMFLPSAVSAKADAQADAETLLAAFNREQTVETANSFLKLVEDTGLSEETQLQSETASKETLQAIVWYWASEWYYYHQQFERAADYGQRALPLFHARHEAAHTPETLQAEADCANLLAVIYVRMGDLNKALVYAKRCHELDLESGDNDNISSSLNTLASIYVSAQQPKEAEKHILEGIRYAEKADNTARLAVLLGTASEVEHGLGKEEEALKYARRAYNLEKQLGRRGKAAMRLSQAASALKALGRDAEAREALEEAIPVFRQDGNRHSLGICCNQMGDLLYQAGRFDEAEPYYREALDIFHEQHDLLNESHSHKGLQEVLRESNPKEAMEHADRYNQLRDSLYRNETSSALSRYTVEYGNRELQEQNTAIQTSLKRTNLLIVLLILLTLSVIVWMVHFFRKREKNHIGPLQQEIAELKDTLEQAIEQTPNRNGAPSPVGTAPAVTDEEEQLDDDTRLLRCVEDIVRTADPMEGRVENVAAALGMTAQTFRRRIMAVTGKSPKAYLTDIQMQQAARILLNYPDMPVSEIGQRCGFSEASSFTRMFKKRYGMTPSLFRERKRLSGGIAPRKKDSEKETEQ